MVNNGLTPGDRFLNTLLLGSMIILWLSGIIMLYGSWMPWLYDIHRSTGFSFIVLIPLKAVAVYRYKSREMVKTFKQRMALLNSFILFALSLLIIAFGIMWMWRLGPYSYLKQTILAWHWSLGVLVTPFLVLHTWQNWPYPRKADFLSRRIVLKMLGLVGASIVFGRVAKLLAEIQATEERPRRFTGSRGFGIFSGNNFPTTGEGAVVLDPNQWQLLIDGAVNVPLTLTYKDLLAIQPHVMTEAIDCHNGWDSLQEWRGIPLASLLEKAKLMENATGILMTSITGLSNTYPIDEAFKILLATHVSGEVLNASHGFPLRAVVPERRAWFWL